MPRHALKEKVLVHADGTRANRRIDTLAAMIENRAMTPSTTPGQSRRLAIRIRAWAIGLFISGPLLLEGAELRVMTFNLWVGGDAGKQPLERTVDVVREAKADVVGLQETHGYAATRGQRGPDNGQRIADQLKWHYFAQAGRMGILSRHPIVTNTPGRHGVSLRLPSGTDVWMFNTHLNHAPYQPYQLLNIPYANAPFLKTAKEAVAAARAARGAEIAQVLADLKPVLAAGHTVFLTGDFNEPSHLDWTPRAAAAGKCPLAVEYPSTQAVIGAGLMDAYRSVFPDEVSRPGWTWTPTTEPTDPKDRHDRIDFVFVAGNQAKLKRCEIVGEREDRADIVVKPYPSDHRAVVATVEIR